jgi:hypothetical protein
MHGKDTPPPKDSSDDTRPLTQAERVIARFGGVPGLVRALRQAGFHKQRAAIYKWTYPKSRGGTGGLIPTSAMHEILVAARMEGITLTAQDWDPKGEVLRPRGRPGPKVGWKKAKEKQLKRLREELAEVEKQLAARGIKTHEDAKASDDGVTYE